MKRLSLKSKKINGIQKLDSSKKKYIDYSEMAYREAVSKLKYLLAESYASKSVSGDLDLTHASLLISTLIINNLETKSLQQNLTLKLACRDTILNISYFTMSQNIKDYQYSNTKANESEEDVDNKSVVMNNCKSKDLPNEMNTVVNTHFTLCKSVRPTKTYSNVTSSSADSRSVPPELNSFIEQQEEYIQQLQQESQFCRNQLNKLLHKVREVVAENEALHYKNKTGFFKCVLDEYTHLNETEDENVKEKSVQIETCEVKKCRTLEGPNIVFESRIAELEAQLTQTKLELRKVQEKNQYNLKRTSNSYLSNDTSDMKAQLEKTLHAKYEAETKVQDLQKALTAVREQESEAVQKMKRTLDAMQQIQFEKNQCDIEVKRLKDELDRQHGKFREVTQEASKRIAEERQQIERRYSQQVEQLSADLASQWDAASKSQLESEKQRRELAELRRELSQKQTFIDSLNKELQNKISNLQSDLNQALTEKNVVEQEVLALKLTIERTERQSRQEQSRLQIEINSYKQRLERTEADVVHLRRENLRLSEHTASLEKEINEDKSITGLEDICVQAPTKLEKKNENEKELTSMIIDMETKHAATVAGLEDVLNNQATIVSRLTAECQSLTQRLEANNLKHKEEMANLQNNIDYLSDKIQNTLSKQQGIVSMESRDMLPNALIQTQSTRSIIPPNVIYQEHSMKINNINNQSLGTDLSSEKEYSVDCNMKNDLKTKVQTYEENQNQNQDNDHKHVIDHQTMESYVPDQEREQQRHNDIIQNSDEVTLSQYYTLNTQ